MEKGNILEEHNNNLHRIHNKEDLNLPIHQLRHNIHILRLYRALRLHRDHLHRDHRHDTRAVSLRMD